MADKDKDKAKVDLGLLEEDDEFEEFPAEGEIIKSKQIDDNDKQNSKHLFIQFQDWADSTESAVEEELSVWEDNWDDDNLDVMDDFNEQLKQQMNKK